MKTSSMMLCDTLKRFALQPVMQDTGDLTVQKPATAEMETAAVAL